MLASFTKNVPLEYGPEKKSRGNFVKQASHQSRYLNWSLNNAKIFGGTFVSCTEIDYKGF